MHKNGRTINQRGPEQTPGLRVGRRNAYIRTLNKQLFSVNWILANRIATSAMLSPIPRRGNCSGFTVPQPELRRPTLWQIVRPRRLAYGFFGFRAVGLRLSWIAAAPGCPGNEESRLAASCRVADELGVW